MGGAVSEAKPQMEAVLRSRFQELWKDLGPKMAAKNLGRDFEVEEIYLLGWATGYQHGGLDGINEARQMLNDARAGKLKSGGER